MFESLSLRVWATLESGPSLCPHKVQIETLLLLVSSCSAWIWRQNLEPSFTSCLCQPSQRNLLERKLFNSLWPLFGTLPRGKSLLLGAESGDSNSNSNSNWARWRHNSYNYRWECQHEQVALACKRDYHQTSRTCFWCFSVATLELWNIA